MNDLESRVNHCLEATGSGIYVKELLAEVWDKLTYQEDTVKKMISVLIDERTALVSNVKALEYEMGILRKGIEATATETAKWYHFGRG